MWLRFKNTLESFGGATMPSARIEKYDREFSNHCRSPFPLRQPHLPTLIFAEEHLQLDENSMNG
jgi:hypothetical protein